MAHNLYSGFAIQNTFMSTVVLVNEVSEVLQRHYLQSAIQSINQSINVLGNLPRSGSYGFMYNIHKHIKHVNTYGSKGSKKQSYSVNVPLDFCTTADHWRIQGGFRVMPPRPKVACLAPQKSD